MPDELIKRNGEDGKTAGAELNARSAGLLSFLTIARRPTPLLPGGGITPPLARYVRLNLNRLRRAAARLAPPLARLTRTVQLSRADTGSAPLTRRPVIQPSAGWSRLDLAWTSPQQDNIATGPGFSPAAAWPEGTATSQEEPELPAGLPYELNIFSKGYNAGPPARTGQPSSHQPETRPESPVQPAINRPPASRLSGEEKPDAGIPERPKSRVRPAPVNRRSGLIRSSVEETSTPLPASAELPAPAPIPEQKVSPETDIVPNRAENRIINKPEAVPSAADEVRLSSTEPVILPKDSARPSEAFTPAQPESATDISLPAAPPVSTEQPPVIPAGPDTAPSGERPLSRPPEPGRKPSVETPAQEPSGETHQLVTGEAAPAEYTGGTPQPPEDIIIAAAEAAAPATVSGTVPDVSQPEPDRSLADTEHYVNIIGHREPLQPGHPLEMMLPRLTAETPVPRTKPVANITSRVTVQKSASITKSAANSLATSIQRQISPDIIINVPAGTETGPAAALPDSQPYRQATRGPHPAVPAEKTRETGDIRAATVLPGRETPPASRAAEPAATTSPYVSQPATFPTGGAGPVVIQTKPQDDRAPGPMIFRTAETQSQTADTQSGTTARQSIAAELAETETGREATSPDIDAIARDVYRILKRRLARERERTLGLS